MSAEPLKPCPFCGERPRLTLRPDDAEASTYFAAVACYCGGYSACAHKMATATTADEAEAKARSLWDDRATLDAAVAAARAEERKRCETLARYALDAATEGNWVYAAVLLQRINGITKETPK